MDYMQRKERDAQLFDQHLYSALNVALSGETALVIVPPRFPKHAVLTRLVQLVPQDRAYQVRMPGNELHFEGTRGSVRVYDSDNYEYDSHLKRLRGYPRGIPTFLHPELDLP
jgi:hypothetical protein